MKLILTHEVTGLGAPGDLVEVKDGYGRNYLLTRGLPVSWSKGGEKQVTAIRKARSARAIATRDEAQQIRQALESRVVTITAKAGSGVRLFGAVTPADVAEGVVAVGGPQIDKRKVELTTPIKSVGDFSAKVRLHDDVSATVKIKVVAG